MNLRVANSDDLSSVLDRILDKGIVADSWVCLSTEGIEPILSYPLVTLDSATIYVGYDRDGAWREIAELDELFPFWRRDLWTK